MNMNRAQSFSIALILCVLLGGCMLDETSSNLAGIWSCTETSEIFLKGAKGTVVFDVTFSQDANNQDKYYIANIYQLGGDVQASIEVKGNVVTLTEQTVTGGYKIKGSGTINDTYDVINMSYTVDDGGGTPDHLKAVFVR